MKKNEPVDLRIESLAADGCGYPADGGYAVHEALPGELVRAIPVAKKRKQLYLRAIDIIIPSPDRRTPLCSASGYCGGCSFQHLAYDKQLEVKTGLLKSALAPLMPVEWLPPVRSAPYHYRSKARLGVRYVEKKGRMLVGFREKHKPYIADVADCAVLCEPVCRLIKPLESLIGSLSVFRAIPQIEVAGGDEEMALVIRHLEAPTSEDIGRLKSFARTHSLQMFMQPGGMDTTYKIFPEDDKSHLSYRLPDHDLELCFAPHDFTQVNLGVNRQMVNLAIDLLEPREEDRVLDAFCGIGNFSLALSRHAGEVIGIEQSETSVERARHNAVRNGVENVRFETMDLQAGRPELSDLHRVNKVLLDPPRSGAEGLVKTLARHNVERVVYVSCNPETLARDVKILCQQGFELRSVGIIDMFPHTTHAESIAFLTRPLSSL